jgi:hypothetical protein
LNQPAIKPPLAAVSSGTAADKFMDRAGRKYAVRKSSGYRAKTQVIARNLVAAGENPPSGSYPGGAADNFFFRSAMSGSLKVKVHLIKVQFTAVMVFPDRRQLMTL